MFHDLANTRYKIFVFPDMRHDQSLPRREKKNMVVDA